MKYKEFGNENAETVILLHGGGLSWWNYRDEARFLQSEYRLILPILDGHAESDRHFASIEDNADEIISFIDENLGGRVMLIGGLSLGGQILLEILSRRGDICRYAVAESASVIPSRLTHALVGPVFGGSYGLIKNRSFAKLQFRSLHMRPELFEDYYRDTCMIAKEDMISFLKASTAYSLNASISDASAKVYVFAGENENRAVLRSAEAICEALSGCEKKIIPGMYHGDFSVNHPQMYAEAVRDIINKR